tara:strand:+ start:515 stop:1912 length:1398 start_codon:yes stop_codon:yes gene_type:complete
LIFFDRKNTKPRLGHWVLGVCLMAFVLFSSVFTAKNANACDTCYGAVSGADSNIWQESQDNFDRYLDREFKRVEQFIIQEMWEQSILPVMMLSAEQFTAVALQQAMIIGMFIDAESQMDAQRLLQEIRAKVHKDYQPSVGMCEFGSVVKSLAATEIRGETFAVVFSRRSQDRHLGKGDSSGAYGSDLDQANRIMHFKRLFCNEKDRRGALIPVCDNEVYWNNASFQRDGRARINKDIDYFSLMDSPWNLKIDFTNQEILDAAATPPIHNEDEEHLFALSSNLFGHMIFPRPPAKLLENQSQQNIKNMQKYYIDMRAIQAKRSVAENSLYAIAAMKAEAPLVTDLAGGADKEVNSRLYMEHILGELGIPSAEILVLLGENPSYYAQMEVLTKKLYQNPDFYTNLYDKPANVERKTVALQAIKLMQKFDMLKSFLRGEATVSMLLELAVVDLQNEVEDQIRAMDGSR